MATLIEIIIIIIASPEKRVLNNLHCSQVDIGRSAKNNCIARRHDARFGGGRGDWRAPRSPLHPPPVATQRHEARCSTSDAIRLSCVFVS